MQARAARQLADLESIVSAIALEQPQQQGFDATLLAWRRATAAAALSFVDDITPSSANRDLTASLSGLFGRRR